MNIHHSRQLWVWAADGQHEEGLMIRARDVAYDGSLPQEQWLAMRKQEALKIGANAEVAWVYGLTLDPYGVHRDVPEELQQVGREYFARSPGREIWVSFEDLPECTSEALWQKHDRRLVFPAGFAAARAEILGFEEK
jgi:hypothetical protein